MQHVTFLPAPEYLAKLQIAIRAAHGYDAEHEATWMGVEHHGSSLWSGSVEVFRLLGENAPAGRAYAWSKVEGGQLQCIVVLQSEEVNCARAAVRHVLSKQLAPNDQTLAA